MGLRGTSYTAPAVQDTFGVASF